MAVTPQISLIAYEARDGRVFVKVPNERGRYMLVERCVIEVECSHCLSAIGEPCKGAYDGRHAVQTHVARRLRHKATKKSWSLPRADDQIEKPRFKLKLSGSINKAT